MATFYNQATLSYNGISTTSNITTGEIVEVLAVDKNAVVSTYTANSKITYVLSLVNSGTTAFTDLTISDNLGAYAFGTQSLVPLTYVTGSVQYYVNGALQSTPTATAGPPLTISGISVPAGGNALILYEATTNEYAPLATGDNISNDATISGSGLSTPVIATGSVSASPDPTLSISKSLNPVTVNENGQITYTFLIENSGNTAAQASDNVVITDTFDPILNPISVTFNGTTWSSPTNYSYDTTTGVFTSVAGQITVPAATYTQNPTTGEWTINPGVSTLVITGTV